MIIKLNQKVYLMFQYLRTEPLRIKKLSNTILITSRFTSTQINAFPQTLLLLFPWTHLDIHRLQLQIHAKQYLHKITKLIPKIANMEIETPQVFPPVLLKPKFQYVQGEREIKYSRLKNSWIFSAFKIVANVITGWIYIRQRIYQWMNDGPSSLMNKLIHCDESALVETKTHTYLLPIQRHEFSKKKLPYELNGLVLR